MKRRLDMDMNVNQNKLMKPITTCCLCAKIDKEETFVSIFSTKGKINQLQEKIINYTPFKVDTNSNMQQHICVTCMIKINQWHDFIQACIDAQNKISSRVSTDIIQTENISSTSTKTTSTKLTPEKQCIVTQSLNMFLTSKKAESEELNPSKTLLQSRKIVLKNCKEKTLSNQSSRRRYCIARWCGNNSKKLGISLFRLPKDKKRAHLWLTNAEREDLKNLSSEVLHTKYLCMEHFTDDKFMNSYKRKLVWNAVPTHFPKPKFAVEKESQTNLQNNIVVPPQLIIISKSHLSSKQRPIKPKPLNIPRPATALNESNQESRASSNSEDSVMTSLTEINKTCKVKNNPTDKFSNIRIKMTSAALSSETKKVENVADLNPAKTVKLKTYAIVNNLVDLKQDKLKLVRTSEFSSVPNTDLAKKDNNVSSCEKKITSENYSFMSEEAYLNCDAESICLEHAFRETNERIYPCRYCGEMFLVKSNLILHQTTYHSDRPVGCDSCGRVLYKSRSEFMEHVCDHRNESGTHTDDH